MMIPEYEVNTSINIEIVATIKFDRMDFEIMRLHEISQLKSTVHLTVMKNHSTWNVLVLL